MQTLDRIASRIATAETVTVLTGAGISTDSGIPDFRGPNGVWTRDPAAERKATIQGWMEDPELRREAWRFRLANQAAGHAPNAGHRALVDLERLDRLSTLVTQNVDGLHLDAGHRPERVVEIHGTARAAACLGCRQRSPLEDVLERVAAGDDDPHCIDCGGLLKSATISFGQALVEEDVERAYQAAVEADVFLALGTSLAVYPVAALPDVAARSGAFVAIVNGQPTERDELGDEVVLGRLGDVLPDLVARVQARLAEA